MTAVIMKRWSMASAFVFVLLASASPVLALDEGERLWLVGERAFADGIYPVARRALDRFVAQYPHDARLADAVLLLAKARLALGELEPALEAFRRAQTFSPPPGSPLEAKFWEAEMLFRLKRYGEARAAYDEVVRRDAASPHAPEALYGYAWTELELGRPEPAVTAFRDFLQTWPQHALGPSATFNLARALADVRRFDDAVALLEAFPTKYPGHKLAPDAQFLLGWSRVSGGDVRRGLPDLRAFVAAHPAHEQAPAARRLLGEALARSGGREELQEAYQALVNQTPPTPEALLQAAGVAGRLGRARDQEAVWRKLRDGFPDHPLARRAALELATAAFKRKEWKEASTLAQAAAETDDEGVKAEALLLTGESELKLRRYPGAAKAFEGVAAVGNVDAGVRYRALAGLGLAREEQREWRLALAAYESVASGSPDSTLREWARQRASAVKGRLKPKTGS